MTAMQTLAQLKQHGVVLTIEDGKLRYRAPHGAMTDELKQALADHKAEIIAELQREGPPYPDGQGRVKCVYCSRLDKPSCPSGERYGISLLRECGAFGMRAGGAPC